MSVSKRLALLAERKKSSDAQPKNVAYLEQNCPVLLEMLTIIPPAAVEKKTASVLIFCDEDEVKVLVNDRGVGRKAWMRLEEVDESFFTLLEDFVTGEHTDWRFPKHSENGERRH